MKQQIAQAEADKLRSDDRVEDVSIEGNTRSMKLVVEAKDSIAQAGLKKELHDFATWVEFVDE